MRWVITLHPLHPCIWRMRLIVEAQLTHLAFLHGEASGQRSDDLAKRLAQKQVLPQNSCGGGLPGKADLLKAPKHRQTNVSPRGHQSSSMLILRS